MDDVARGRATIVTMVVRSLHPHLLEESCPLHLSQTAQLAPQELYRPSKAPLKAPTELGQTDRNRLRRHKKATKREAGRQREERARALARLDPRKQGALDKREALKTLSKNKNVTILPHVQKKHAPKRGKK